jgi:DNA-binding response OmpR family regulator
MDQQKRLLIIDDDPEFVDGLKGTLEAAGYQVDAAYDPKEGFEALKENRYDLLLLDILMGRGAEGVPLARKIRKTPRLASLPILVVTGMRQQMEFLFRGRSVSANLIPGAEVLEKPVDPNVLLAKIGALVKSSGAAAAKVR